MQRDVFDEQTYIAFNDAIFEYFFNQDRSGQLTTLAFDDNAAVPIAAELALTGPQLTKRLCAMVGSLINPAKEDPYTFWSRRNPRLTTALLACSVLVMSRLGSDESGQIQHRGFHKLYNLEILRLESIENVPNIRRQDELWRRFAAHMVREEGGLLGRLAFLPLLNYVHLNYPASQCLVRMTDRRRLQGLFHEYLDPANELDKDLIARLLGLRVAGLTLMLQRAVSHLGQGDALSRQMWQIIRGEYEVWRASPEQAARRLLQRRNAELRDVQRRGVGVSHSINPQNATPIHLPPKADSPIVAPVKIRMRPARSRLALRFIASRFVLVEPYRLPASLYVEIKSVSENDLSCWGTRFADGWVRLPGEVGASDFINGFERIIGSNRLREYGKSICAFARTDVGWIETEKLTLGPLRIVYAEESTSVVVAAATIASEYSVTEMADPGLYCISITLKSGVKGAELPPLISDILSESLTSLKLTSGLRLRDGLYMADGPPHVVFGHPTEESLELYLNGRPIGLATREVAFNIPSDHCSSGRHVVRVGDRERSFVVADDDYVQSQACSSIDLDTDLGTVVARHPPRMETSASAEAMKTKELGRLNAVVVVGSDLLLPYSRAVLL